MLLLNLQLWYYIKSDELDLDHIFAILNAVKRLFDQAEVVFQKKLIGYLDQKQKFKFFYLWYQKNIKNLKFKVTILSS